MTICGPKRPPAEKIFADLEMIWDCEQLAPGDFMKPGRIEEVFDKYAAVFRKDAWWLDAFGVSREQAEREGFFEWKRSRQTELRSPSNSARG
jgi:hypothetical protein